MATQRPGLKANGSLCASVMPSMPIVCRLMSISSQERLPPAPANLPPICLESRHRGTSKVFPSSIQVATPRKSCAGEIKDARIPLSCVGWRSSSGTGDSMRLSRVCDLPACSHVSPAFPRRADQRQSAWRLKSDRPSYAPCSYQMSDVSSYSSTNGVYCRLHSTAAISRVNK